MLKKIQSIVVALVVSAGVGLVATAPMAYAAPANEVQKGLNAAGGSGSSKTKPEDIIKLIVTVLLYIIGAVSVIMIVIGGFRYVISQGDSSQLTSAKNTILYAIIGLLVALFAFAIVNFIVDRFV